VTVEDEFSDLTEFPAGVPQGSVIGPILYIIYCSDLPYLNDCKYAMYADDLAIFSSHEFSHVIQTNLQCALFKIDDYFKKWKIKINASKTQTIFFTRKRSSRFLPVRNLSYEGNEILWSSSIKYLGVELDKKLTFANHIRSIKSKVNLAIKILYPLINRKSKLNIANKIIILKVVFQPLILYACPAWGTCAKTHIKSLQILQNKLLRMILNVPWHFSTLQLHSKTEVPFID